MSGARYASQLDRIEANSMPIPFTGCWIWMGSTRRNQSGELYPALSIRRKSGRRRGKVRKVGAHRYAIAAAKGIPLSRVRVCAHLCNQSLCVNPAHLRATTYRVNNLMQERYK